MSGSGDSLKGPTKSVLLAAEKTRDLRIQRLRLTLDTRLQNPMATLDALVAEAAEGDPQVELWEKLHVAAMRDGREREVGEAYERSINSPRMRRLAPEAQADVLMHAADFFQGIQGKPEVAERFLSAVIALAPGHPEAFPRLERRLEKVADDRGLLELYAGVAADPPRAVTVLATQTLNRLVRLKGGEPVSDEACKKLVALVPENPKILSTLEAHCRTTKRPALACELIELAIAHDTRAPAAPVADRRRRLVDLYLGEAADPARAIDHVEALLEHDPHDAAAFKAAERLMSHREVSSRATAALQKARRARAGAP